MPRTLAFPFPLANGLHARPATALREHTRTLPVEVRLANGRNGRSARSTDVLALVALDVRRGDPCTVTISGDDEERAAGELTHWFESVFPHCDDALPVAAASASLLGTVLPRLLAASATRHWCGSGVSDGLGAGVAVLAAGGLPVDLPPYRRGDTAAEAGAFMAACRRTAMALEEARQRAVAATERGVIEAHAAMLDDGEWRQRVAAAIAAGAGAAAAVLAVARADAASFSASDNAYLAGRAADVCDVARRLLAVLPGGIPPTAAPRLATPSVVVADDLAPSDFLAIDRAWLRGLVLARGSATGHTAILARSFAIPCVVGAAVVAEAGTPLLVDGSRGLVVAQPAEAVTRYYAQERHGLDLRRQRIAAVTAAATTTVDGRRLLVEANLAGDTEAAGAFAAGAEGIGLFRTEMLFLGRPTPPGEDEQEGVYRAVAVAANRRPVTIRLLDVGGDKHIPWLDLPVEANPFLGVRGVRLYADHAELVRTQIRAVLRAALHGDLRIMIPMVADAGEIRLVRTLIGEAVEQLRAAGVAHRAAVPVGIMVEVPAAAAHLPALARHADFLCVGTNDLAQYVFAADRGNPRVCDPGQEAHPAFLRVLARIVVDGHAAGLRVAVCGEMAGRRALTPLLVGLGVDELSVAPPRLPELKAAIAGLDATRCALLVQECLDLDSSAAVLERLTAATLSTVAMPLVDADLVVLDVEARSKEEAIKALVERLRITGRTADPQAVEEAVWAREGVYSTGIGHGFAIPHCQCPALAASAVVVMRFAEPIAWQSLDGGPVRMAAMLAIRPAEGADAHLKVFARLARKLMSEEFRAGLMRAPDAAAVATLLGEHILG